VGCGSDKENKVNKKWIKELEVGYLTRWRGVWERKQGANGVVGPNRLKMAERAGKHET
jgi:hypothetical protein